MWSMGWESQTPLEMEAQCQIHPRMTGKTVKAYRCRDYVNVLDYQDTADKPELHDEVLNRVMIAIHPGQQMPGFSPRARNHNLTLAIHPVQ